MIDLAAAFTMGTLLGFILGCVSSVVLGFLFLDYVLHNGGRVWGYFRRIYEHAVSGVE